MPSPLLPAPPRRFWWALLALVLAATAARAYLQFGTPLAPGINGAYYFVQARAMLETGALGVPDLPLTFWLHAGLARVIEAVFGMASEEAIILAVKSADSLLPALIAWPLGLLGWRLQANRPNPSVLAAIAPAAVACLGTQALSMTGDFQKNSLALVWLAMLGLGAHGFISAPGWRTARLPLGSLALLGLTHVGVLGTGLVFAALLGLISLFAVDPDARRKILIFAGGGGLILTCAGLLIYHAYDPTRVKRLLNAASDPATLVSSGRPGNYRAAQALPPPPTDFADQSSPRAMPDQPPADGPRGGPPGFGPFAGAMSATLLSLAAAAVLAAVWQRKRLLPADRTVILAAALAAAAVGGPWFDGDKAMRLVPMAAVLLAITLPFLLGLIPWRLIAALASSVVIAASAASAALYLPRGGEPTIGENAFAELRALRRQVEAGNRTLIVARHGLEWWTAWTLHTHIAQPTAVTKEDWSTFDRVLYLVENDTPNHHRRPPRDAGLRFDGPPRRLRDQPAPSGASNADDFPPPPENDFAQGPDDTGAPAPGSFGGPRGGPGGGAFTNRLPENARILHKSAALTLAQADSPPESLLRPRPRPESAR